MCVCLILWFTVNKNDSWLASDFLVGFFHAMPGEIRIVWPVRSTGDVHGSLDYSVASPQLRTAKGGGYH